jgi:hypothetical protein
MELSIDEIVAEPFSDIRCPLALVLGSPLPPLRVLAVTSRITHLSMANKSNIRTNKQTHIRSDAGRNESTEKQKHWQTIPPTFNNNSSNTQYTLYVHKLIVQWTG